MCKVLVNRLGGLSLLRKSVVRLPVCPDMIIGVFRERKQQHNNNINTASKIMYTAI